ncbi:MAG TPA: SurA N-terminal domain-containing protein [bacterium]|nr:SurA N-terminal domain-containing protein [bacterium]
MFTDLRKKSGSIIVYLMFAAIIVTFVISFGPGDQGCQAQPNWVVMVNGDAITQAEFRFTYNNYYDFYQRMIPDFNAKKAKEMNLSKNALDSLIDVMLMAQNADKLGFVATDDEVRKEITDTPYFQKEGGTFDRDQYTRFVQFQMGMTISSYEEKVRRDLLAEKVRRFLTDSADISESELKDEFVKKNETVDAQFLVFGEAQMKPEAKEKIKNGDTVDKERLAALTKAEAAKALSLFNSGTYKPELLKKDFPDWDLTIKDQAGILRDQKYIQDIGISGELVTQLFAQKVFPAYLAAPVMVDEKAVVAQVVKHNPADMVKFETEKEGIRRSLQAGKARAITTDYAKALREKASLETNEYWLSAFQESGGEPQ